jgi:hypothetical protein
VGSPSAAATSDAANLSTCAPRVVDVVLPEHLRAPRREHAAQRVADGGPAGAAEVDRTRRVRRDELQVDRAATQLVTGAVGVGRREDLPDERALGVGREAQVDEPGTGRLGARHAVAGGEGLGEPGGQVARGHARLLGGAQRDVGGVVAVLRVAGALDADVGGEGRDVQAARGEDLGRGGPDEVGELVGSHQPSLGGAAHEVLRYRSYTRSPW